MWLEKTFVENINVFHKRIPTYIYREGCPIRPIVKKEPTNEEIECIYNYSEEYLRKIHA